MAQNIYGGLKAAPVETVLYDIDTGVPYVIPQASSVVLDMGIAETVREVANGTGVRINALRFPNEEKPSITLNFPSLVAPIIGLKTGRKFDFINGVETIYARNALKLSSNSIPAATSGFEGFGLTADDPTAYAAVYIDGVARTLTRVSFAGFNPAIPDQWAQGANGAILFSNTLFGQAAVGSFVTFKVQQTLNNLVAMTDEAFTQFGMILVFVDIEQRVFRLRAPSVTVILEGSTIDFNADAFEVQFDINLDPSNCLAFQMEFLNDLRRCQDAS